MPKLKKFTGNCGIYNYPLKSQLLSGEFPGTLFPTLLILSTGESLQMIDVSVVMLWAKDSLHIFHQCPGYSQEALKLNVDSFATLYG